MPDSPAALNILLVEDHGDTSRAVARLLLNEGHIVRCAYDGEQALRAAAEAPVDLLICDLRLPGVDGFEVMRRLKSRYGLPGISISGHVEAEDAERSAEAGFSAHLVKPLEWKVFRERIAAVVAENRPPGP
jgi:CheY-like chemotaxis protein